MTSSANVSVRRRRGNVEWLPSGSARVKVYAGLDPVSGREMYIRELVKAKRTKRETEREADRVLTKLLNQVDERRNPRTNAKVNQLLDRWLDVVELSRKTRTGYVGKIEKHIRPTIGRLPVARIDTETIDSLYASLRRCRDHCDGRSFVVHRTEGEHVCDEHSPRRKCAKVVLEDPTADCKWCRRACGPHVCVRRLRASSSESSLAALAHGHAEPDRLRRTSVIRGFIDKDQLGAPGAMRTRAS